MGKVTNDALKVCDPYRVENGRLRHETRGQVHDDNPPPLLFAELAVKQLLVPHSSNIQLA